MKKTAWLPLVSFSLVVGVSHAELRMYDASSKQSVAPVSRETKPQAVDKKPNVSIVGASPTGVVSPQGQPVQRPGGLQVPTSKASPLLAPPLLSPAKSTPQPAQRPAAGAGTAGATLLRPGQQTPAAASQAVREAEGIYLFTSIRAYSPSIFKVIQTLKADGHSRMRVFMGDATPVEFARFVTKNSAHIPQDGFSVDTQGLMAKRLGVNQPNTLAYVAPEGSIRLYHLPEGLENLQRQLQRLQKPTSTKNTKKR